MLTFILQGCVRTEVTPQVKTSWYFYSSVIFKVWSKIIPSEQHTSITHPCSFSWFLRHNSWEKICLTAAFTYTAGLKIWRSISGSISPSLALFSAAFTCGCSATRGMIKFVSQKLCLAAITWKLCSSFIFCYTENNWISERHVKSFEASLIHIFSILHPKP